MSKAKFTPGEWRKHPPEDGRGVAFVEVVSPSGLQGDADILCTLSNHADARLFAAAKDLYEALEGMLNYFKRPHRVADADATIDGAINACAIAERALAKARGEK